MWASHAGTPSRLDPTTLGRDDHDSARLEEVVGSKLLVILSGRPLDR